MVNETKDYDREFPAGYVNAHGGGRRMLRIAAAARDHGGNDAVAALYTALGEELHTGGRSAEIREADYRVIDDAVAAAGLPPELVARGEDEALDLVLREETELGLSRTGKDVGTPILTLAPGTDREASIFGPVIARIPRGEEALRIWDAAELLVRTPGLRGAQALRSRPPGLRLTAGRRASRRSGAVEHRPCDDPAPDPASLSPRRRAGPRGGRRRPAAGRGWRAPAPRWSG